MTCGIYAITNTINGNCYVGQSSNIERRWRDHIRHLSKSNDERKTNAHLFAAWKKHNSENFQFLILEECPIDRLTEREQYWADSLRDQGVELYNYGAYTDSPLRGKPRPEETKLKLSVSHTGKHIGEKNGRYGKPVSDETRKKISSANKGRTWTNEERDAMSKRVAGKGNPRYGKTASAETRAKMSAIHKGKTISPAQRSEISARTSGNNNHFFGKKHTKETRSKLSEANKGHTPTDETRAKLSAAGMGRKHSPETLAKISAGNKGKTVSNETRLKLSLANSGRKPTDEQRSKMSAAGKGKRTGENCPTAKLNWEKVREIRQLLKLGTSVLSISEQYDIGRKTVFNIAKNKSWIEPDSHEIAIPPTRRKKVISAEARAKMSAANKGKIVSDETRLKLSIANIGKKPSKETLVKLSAAHKGENNNSSKLTLEQVREIRQLHNQGTTATTIAKTYNMTITSICNIIKQKTWKE